MLVATREDTDLSSPITDESGMFREMGFESIDLIGLASSIEAHFGQALPFPEFIAKMKQQNATDIKVGSIVDFLMENLGTPAQRLV